MASDLTPALPPELAERIAALEATIAECRASIDCDGTIIQEAQERIERRRMELGCALSVKHAIEATVAALTKPAPEPQPGAPARVRHAVRGAVMVVMKQFAEPISEPTINESLGLPIPEESVHSYLLRAVRAGELVREGEMYRLPATPAPAEQQEALISVRCQDNSYHGETEGPTPALAQEDMPQ